MNVRIRYRTIAMVVVGTGVGYSFLTLLAMRWWHRFWRVPEPHPERRRAHRVFLAAPVFVYGRLGNRTFWENTETVNVSAIGGMIPLSIRFESIPPKVIITNSRTEEDMLCRVARVENEVEYTILGFEFLLDSPRFWQVDFATK